MDTPQPRRNPFEPTVGAISDSWLQIRARPAVFLLIWLTLSIAPILLLAILFLEPLTNALAELMRLLQVLIGMDGDPTQLIDEYRTAFLRYLKISGLLLVLFTVTSSYLGAVLHATVERFRSRAVPSFSGSLRTGLSLFPGFLITVVLAGLRIFLVYLAGSFTGVALGMLIGDITVVPMMLSGIFIFIALQRYALAPFIRLATGIPVPDAIRLSRAYHRTRRAETAGLFFVVILIPMMTVVAITNLFQRFELMIGAGRYVVGIIQGLLQFLLVIVLINFTMNSFPREEDSNTGRETTAGS